jgi:hypothetical protein
MDPRFPLLWWYALRGPPRQTPAFTVNQYNTTRRSLLRWQYQQAHLTAGSCSWILTDLAWVVRRSEKQLDDASNLQIGERYLVDSHSRRHFDKCTIYSGNQWLLLCFYCDCGSGADICSCNYAKNIWNGWLFNNGGDCKTLLFLLIGSCLLLIVFYHFKDTVMSLLGRPISYS